eukprot:gene33981-43897_t
MTLGVDAVNLPLMRIKELVLEILQTVYSQNFGKLSKILKVS